MPATSVKVFHSSMPGAPTLTGAAGSLIALLDACLINGFGLKTVDSLVVSGGVATATISSGHSFEVGSVALIAGATPSALNGEWRVAEITATTVKFNVSGVPDGTAAGTITIKVAPLGWIKQYSGTNVAVYKRSVPEATAMVLRVDDTGTLSARVRGFESMSDVNTGLGPFPTDSQVSGGLYWSKAHSTSGMRQWLLIGDERAFYYCVAPNNVDAHQVLYFGDLIPARSADAYSCAISGGNWDTNNTATVNAGCMAFSTNEQLGGSYLPRSDLGIQGAIIAGHRRLSHSIAFTDSYVAYSGGYSGFGSFPNRPDNGLLIEPVYCTPLGQLRGRFPGIFHLTQYADRVFLHRSVVDGVGVFAGKRLLVVSCAPAQASSRFPVMFQLDDWERP